MSDDELTAVRRFTLIKELKFTYEGDACSVRLSMKKMIKTGVCEYV